MEDAQSPNTTREVGRTRGNRCGLILVIGGALTKGGGGGGGHHTYHPCPQTEEGWFAADGIVFDPSVVLFDYWRPYGGVSRGVSLSGGLFPSRLGHGV